MSQPIVVVDIDDVLSQSAAGFADYSNKRWQSNITANDYSEEWAVVWGVSVEEAIARSLAFHESDAIASYLHYADAVPVLKELSKRFTLVIATARREMMRESTMKWLETHFKGVFSAVHLAGIWDGDGEIAHKVNATKADICRTIGANYLIDDQLKHCVGAAKEGIETVLFGDYPWNKTETLPEGVTRAHNWAQVAEYFRER